MAEEIKKLEDVDLDKVTGGLFGYNCKNCGHFGVNEESSKSRVGSDGKLNWEIIFSCPACNGRMLMTYP